MDWVWRVWGYKDPTAANAADDDFEIIQSDTAECVFLCSLAWLTDCIHVARLSAWHRAA